MDTNKNNDEELTPADRFYLNHKRNNAKYQQKNPQKMKEKSQRYYNKIKVEQPQIYEAFLQKKRLYYQTVVKPKKEAQLLLRKKEQLQQQLLILSQQ